MPAPLAKSHADPTGLSPGVLTVMGDGNGAYGTRQGQAAAWGHTHAVLNDVLGFSRYWYFKDSVMPFGASGPMILATLPPVHRVFIRKAPAAAGPPFLTPGVSLNQSMRDPNFIGRSQEHVRPK